MLAYATAGSDFSLIRDGQNLGLYQAGDSIDHLELPALAGADTLDFVSLSPDGKIIAVHRMGQTTLSFIEIGNAATAVVSDMALTVTTPPSVVWSPYAPTVIVREPATAKLTMLS